ncbi:pyruvate formate lyase family protein [Tissierella praeacuta]|uniref:pyruvate formate lyase family protein n=1 Tax=Tissierella praeacuta TaxID=43131 RepID=UPI001C128714|nr:pyruvate formate lyase family protein [Tissierella praeacuta]MBU5255876.1 pyruvate formate lyase family protein [Tissierella praeacuta]
MITERIELARQNYINSKPAISYERARIWTESHKMTEGESIPIRRAKAFRDTCEQIDTNIFEGELIVGAIGEFRKCGILTPDYQDVLFKKGFGGIIKEAEENLLKLSDTSAEDLKKKDFYKSIIITSEGIITLAKRYSQKAKELAMEEKDEIRKRELLKIGEICNKIPENPPTTFYEAIQFIWFTQVGGIISENPLALNVGRFDQFMYPYYKSDIEKGIMTKDQIQELIEAYWIKLSEWVWTISANTAEFFAGYNQFQNLTIGGKTRDGKDATNDLSYMSLKATERIKTHQPGLSVRIHQDCPSEFLEAVTHLVSKGTGFPAIHNDNAGYQMLINAGYEPEDARDWNNCGCVVPHFRKTGEWTSAVNINFTAALEFALNQGKSRITKEKIGLDEKDPRTFETYEEVEDAFYKQFDNLIRHSVIATLLAQKLHKEMVPRPFLSSCIEECILQGKDLVDAGAKYNLGPVLTGIGLAVTSNSLAVIKKLVFEDKVTTMENLINALDANWEGYDDLRKLALDIPKYGNDMDYVDDIAMKMANHYYKEGHKYKDINNNNFNTAFMGISNYLSTGKVVGATPCGRKAKEPLSEGVSPFAGYSTQFVNLSRSMQDAIIARTAHEKY